MSHRYNHYEKLTPRSKSLFDRSLKVIPGGVCHNLRYHPPWPCFIKKAKGSKVWDVDGNEYLDLWMGHYTNILGHAPEAITEAIMALVPNGTHWGMLNEYEVRLAELICSSVPSAEKVRFCCSGTEATMNAIRLARGFTGKKIVLKVAGGWHGTSPDLLVAIRKPFPMPEGLGLPAESVAWTKTIPFNDEEAALKLIEANQDDLACIIVEPVVGSGGFIAARKGYLEALRHAASSLGAVLVFDEVISGFRISLGGAQGKFGVTPDLTALGKIIGGGTPVGAVAGRADIMELSSVSHAKNKWEKVFIGGGTFSCNPLTMAAGVAMVDYLKANEKQIYPRLDRLGHKLMTGAQEAFRKRGVPAKCTGYGSLFMVNFPLAEGIDIDSPEKVHHETDIEKKEVDLKVRMLEKGVHVVHGGGAISAAHTDADVDEITAAYDEVAGDMARELP